MWLSHGQKEEYQQHNHLFKYMIFYCLFSWHLFISSHEKGWKSADFELLVATAKNHKPFAFKQILCLRQTALHYIMVLFFLQMFSQGLIDSQNYCSLTGSGLKLIHRLNPQLAYIIHFASLSTWASVYSILGYEALKFLPTWTLHCLLTSEFSIIDR